MGFHIRISARGIVINGDKVLLNEFGDGDYYNTPGGGVLPGETLKDAVVREIFEESGLNVTVGELIYVLEYEPNSCNFIHGKVPQISFTFRCYLSGDDCIKSPSVPDCNPDNPNIKSKAKWVEFSKLKDINLVPKIQDKILEYYKTNTFAPMFIERENL